MNPTWFSRGTVVLAALVVFAGAQAAEGRIVKLDGPAKIERRGEPVEATGSLAVEDGDELQVPLHSKLQMQMRDDSVFSIPGKTSFKVDSFQMPVPGNKGHALYTLKEGGLRTITGQINKGGGQYELRTAQATITVNGSQYMALLCKGCGSGYADGLYVKGETGVITVANAGGAIALNPGQLAFVPATGGTPIRTDISPFSNPAIAAQYGFDIKPGTLTPPPRIEKENPASPS